jgi:hypothetical protein
MSIYHAPEMTFTGTDSKQNLLTTRWRQTFPSWFQELPPERVGLNGEYDYYGLQKRVEAALSRQFNALDLEHLSVVQRGRVIVLHGWIVDNTLLHILTQVAEQVEGVIRVETFWLRSGTDGLCDLNFAPACKFA